MTENQTPAGWYPDPSGDTTKMRYWDGNAWTNDFQDIQAGAQANAPATGFSPTAGAAVPGSAQTPGTTAGYNPYAPVAQPLTTPVKDTSGFAIAALVLGIVGAALGWCLPIVGVAGGILGIVFGIKGRTSSNKSLATVGLVLGIISLVLGSIFWIINTIANLALL